MYSRKGVAEVTDAAAEALSLNYPPMEHLSRDHKDCPNQHENSQNLCNEMGIPL